MRNINKIRKLSPSELAPMLVQEIIEPDFDYDFEENIHYAGDIYSYKCPDGSIFYMENDAVEHTVDWLLSEFVIV